MNTILIDSRIASLASIALLEVQMQIITDTIIYYASVHNEPKVTELVHEYHVLNAKADDHAFDLEMSDLQQTLLASEWPECHCDHDCDCAYEPEREPLVIPHGAYSLAETIAIDKYYGRLPYTHEDTELIFSGLMGDVPTFCESGELPF